MKNTVPLEISFTGAFKAGLYYWKRILIITLLCGTLGVGIGYIYASQPNTYIGYGADLLPEPQLLPEYTYSQKADELESQIKLQKTYLGVLSSDQFYDQYQYELKKIDAQLNMLESETLLKVRRDILLGYKYPTDDKATIMERLSEEEFLINQKLAQSKADMELLLVPSFKNIESSTEYNNMLASARKLYVFEEEKKLCKQQLSQLSDFQVANQIRDMEYQLSEIQNSLLSTKSELEMIASEIAEEYAVFVKAGFGVNQREPGQFSVQIVTGYFEDRFESKLAAVTIISTLLGLMLSILSAIVSYSRKQGSGQHGSTSV